jgi:hypothetical protein
VHLIFTETISAHLIHIVVSPLPLPLPIWERVWVATLKGKMFYFVWNRVPCSKSNVAEHMSYYRKLRKFLYLFFTYFFVLASLNIYRMKNTALGKNVKYVACNHAHSVNLPYFRILKTKSWTMSVIVFPLFNGSHQGLCRHKR